MAGFYSVADNNLLKIELWSCKLSADSGRNTVRLITFPPTPLGTAVHANGNNKEFICATP